MAALKPGKKGKDKRSKSAKAGGRRKPARAERRDGSTRSIRDLYQSDLDRHLWSWAAPSAKEKRRKEKRKQRRRRRFARIVASAAGAVGAAGLSYFLYRKLRRDDRREDPTHAQADLED
jgi:hypothetical protein